MEIDKELVIQIVIKLVVFLLIFALFSLFGINEFRRINSIAFKRSLEMIRNNTVLQPYFGDRIRRDWLFKGSPILKNESSHVEFEYSIVGTLNKGKVKVVANGNSKKIENIHVNVIIENNEVITIKSE